VKAAYAFIAIVVVAVFAVVALWLVFGRGGATCAERGGQVVMLGMTPLFTGKAMVMVPVYSCEGATP
jgi:hypothetical protein